MAAGSPLIAALLCSLYEADAELPSTAIELYDQRFELLLGKWEKAKNIATLKPSVRRRYFLFLKRLGFELHKAEARVVPFFKAVEIARHYAVKGFHTEPEELVSDCVARGVLERESGGGVSCGHLTYQEYLAAGWLVAENPLEFILKNLVSNWWRNVMEFYAASREDMTPVVRQAFVTRGPRGAPKRMAELVKLAPLTDGKVMLAFREFHEKGHRALDELPGARIP